MIDEPIQLQPHVLSWARTFKQEVVRLETELHDHMTAVHHVGSTAIPGIKSKPIVDIAVESVQYPPSECVVGALENLGYQAHGESGVVGRHWFSLGVPRIIHLHWCPENGSVVQSQLRFRDVLRSDSRLAREYEALKEGAALGKRVDSADYAAAKSHFIAEVLSLPAGVFQ